jgi:phosphate ABC transporter phosphate-binding protein
MKKVSQRPIAAAFPAIRSIFFLLIAGFCVAANAQRVASLSEVKTFYVETFSGGEQAPNLRDSLVRRLAKSDRFRLVQSPKDADAIIIGSSQVWFRGFISINPRTPSTDRQAVYSGYLSLEVVGADRQPLWSWLVTPGRLSWNNIIDDLASRAAKKLVEAAEAAPVPFASQGAANALAQTTLSAAGATFPAPLYQKWFQDFEQLHPGVHILYSPVGSQLGDEKLVEGAIDFAGSDVVPEVAVGDAHAQKLRRFASVLGAVVPIYNLKGITRDLRFTPGVLADIYLGRVRRWNDPEILRSNKGVNLPDAEITVVHRSDGSGTTWVWSEFLSKISPDWQSSVGRGTTLRWPVGIGAEHNEGVVDEVKKTPNSIGYVELTYAIQHQLSFGAVQNRAGEFVRADLQSLVEAARDSSGGSDFAQAIADSPGKHAYPIAAFTWIVIPARTADPVKRTALMELLRWILTSGQKECSALGYVPLPQEIADRQLRMLTTAP